MQAYGSETLDAVESDHAAGVLRGSQRSSDVADAARPIEQPPEKGGLLSDGLVYRYNVGDSPDGMRGRGGHLQHVHLLAGGGADARRAAPIRPLLEEARLIFERMLGFANHLGLYAEETGRRGEALGNFPQAFTHLALISAAFNLDRALGGQRYDP